MNDKLQGEQLEAMLMDCIPGGHLCDPQVVTDNIREWFASHSAALASDAEPVAADDFIPEALQAAIADANHYRAESQSRLEGLTACMEHKRQLLDQLQVYEAAATRKDAGVSISPACGANDLTGLAPPSTAQIEAAMREKCAAWVDKRREAFDAENGYEDSETGAFEYGIGPHAQAKEEYSTELYEIAEGIRAIPTEAAQVERDAKDAEQEIAIGDYVLATKYSDGDPGDPWGVGYYDGFRNGRHYVLDGYGVQIRAGGFRRVGKISPEIGEWLLMNAHSLENTTPAPAIFNLWAIVDAAIASANREGK